LSARATFWAWEVDIPSSEKLVLLCLSDCHNADTGQCNPSVSYIAKKTSLDRKTVLKSLRSLNDRKILSRVKVEGSSNQYFLSIGGSPILGHVQSHISPEPVPNLGHKPINKPKKNLRWEKGDMETVESIFNLLLALNPKHRKPNMDSWANEIRLMRESDGHSHSEIMDLFRFANSDNFWKSNILSPKKLREKWDVLTIKKGDTKQAPTEVWI
tara:strand:- start:6228 stop:6866 length:639 start_codon:yes stop_codon:yes gene_type:complete